MLVRPSLAAEEQTLAVEPDAAQIRNGGSDIVGRCGGAHTDDGADTRGARRRDTRGCVLEHRAPVGRYGKALCGEQIRIGERFPMFDVLARDKHVRGH